MKQKTNKMPVPSIEAESNDIDKDYDMYPKPQT